MVHRHRLEVSVRLPFTRPFSGAKGEEGIWLEESG